MTELWDINKRNISQIITTEKINYWRRRCKKTRLGRVRNDTITNEMEIQLHIMTLYNLNFTHTYFLLQVLYKAKP